MNSLLADVADYYSGKLAAYGETPQGVDWNGTEGQVLRFKQLARLIEDEAPFSLNDLGCGYGALLDYLGPRFPAMSYFGYDISESMIAAASVRTLSGGGASFFTGSSPQQPADYSVASGIFNVRLKHGDAEWRDYVESTIDLLHRSSRRGFAFNCLTAYSDAEKKRDHLYYADPCMIFDQCKRLYSRDVALLHDYGLYEFTVIVRTAR